jgi:hypothetical protein
MKMCSIAIKIALAYGENENTISRLKDYHAYKITKVNKIYQHS